MAEASLDAPEEYYRDVYDEYVERRKCLIDGLNRIPGVYSPIPMGAFYTGINQVRIAYVLKKEDLERALIVLKKALEAYPGRVDE